MDGRENVVEPALAMGSWFKCFSKAHFVVVPVAEIEAAGLSMHLVRVDTPAVDLENTHVDLVDLTARKLATLAEIIAHRIRREDACHDFSLEEMKDLILDAYRKDRLDMNRLRKTLRQQILSAV